MNIDESGTILGLKISHAYIFFDPFMLNVIPLHCTGVYALRDFNIYSICADLFYCLVNQEVLQYSATVCSVLVLPRFCLRVLGKMRNAESRMWNRKCGKPLIGRGVKSRDRCHFADYHTIVSTGNAVKCR